MTQRDPAEEMSPEDLASSLERDGHDTAKPFEGDGQFNSQDMPTTDGEFVDASDSDSEDQEENGYGEYEARNFGEPE